MACSRSPESSSHGFAFYIGTSLAARLGQTLAEPITVGCSSIAVTASIGIARAFDEDSLETILERGDDDMFLRKRSRRSELQRSRPNSPTDPAQIG